MIRCVPKLFWLLCLVAFSLAGWLGYLIGAKPKPSPAIVTITLDFYGFDMDGNRVTAEDEHKTRLNDLKPYELTRPVGTMETLIFTPDSPDRYRVKIVKARWLPKEEYLRLLDGLEADLRRQAPGHGAFWNKLFQDYRSSARRFEKSKFDYPVIFEKRPVR